MTGNAKEVQKIFPGSVLVIDNKVNEKAGGDAADDIVEIVCYIKSNGFEVIERGALLTSDDFNKIAPSISFIILDWRVMPEGTVSDQDNANAVIDFIDMVFLKKFIPIYICSSVNKEIIDNYLVGLGCGVRACEIYKKDNNASCIMVVGKHDIKEDNIFIKIQEWINNNPSIKALKAWENEIEKSKARMFLDMYKASPHWAKIICKTFKDDSGGDSNYANQEMGNFITKNLLSRVDSFTFDLDDPTEAEIVSTKDVLQGERLKKYENENIVVGGKFYTGDIIKKGDDLLLNIKRQCDLIRGNTCLYLLKCNKIDIKDFIIRKSGAYLEVLDRNATNGIKKLNFNSSSDEEVNKRINKALAATNAIHCNKILERANEIIVPCLFEGETYSIDLKNIVTLKISEVENKENIKRKGRLLAPYINLVLHKFSLYFASEGTMSIPKGLFNGVCVVNNES